MKKDPGLLAALALAGGDRPERLLTNQSQPFHGKSRHYTKAGPGRMPFRRRPK
jgi:hypothetical protein